MAIGWLTVLKLVPWGDVIENAPKVAQGAKKLWSTVGKKPVPEAADVITPAQGVLSGQDGALAALQAQVAALQLATTELHQQMLESSALIKSLAEQNTQLVQRVELNRKRMLVIGVLTVLLAVVMAVKYI